SWVEKSPFLEPPSPSAHPEDHLFPPARRSPSNPTCRRGNSESAYNPEPAAGRPPAFPAVRLGLRNRLRPLGTGSARPNPRAHQSLLREDLWIREYGLRERPRAAARSR